MIRIAFLVFGFLATPLHADEFAISAPERFFVGKLESSATLKIIFRPAETVTDHGNGRVDPDGTTVLDQIVQRPGEGPRHRVWRLRQTSPGRVDGTLTGAGPVRGTYANNILRLTYKMDDGIRVEQRLTIAADGRTAINHMVFRKFGLGVATLDGTVRRIAVH